MTFEELNKLSVAIRAKKIEYDAFLRKLDMVIVPEYGVKDEVKGKTFKFHFEDCIYFESIVGSKELFFISWGESHDDVGQDIIDKSASSSLRKSFAGPMLKKAIVEDDYESYFFENDLGSAMKIVCRKVVVEEVK